MVSFICGVIDAKPKLKSDYSGNNKTKCINTTDTEKALKGT